MIVLDKNGIEAVLEELKAKVQPLTGLGPRFDGRRVHASKLLEENLASGYQGKLFLVESIVKPISEVHEYVTDIQIAVHGEAEIVLGGTLMDPARNPKKPEGEFLGDGIEGGEIKKLTYGSIAAIPAGLPHMLKNPKSYAYVIFQLPTRGRS